MPNKTQWSLDDAIAHLIEAQGSLEEILLWLERQRELAKSNMDRATQARLGELDHTVALLALRLNKIDRSVRNARRGEYEENCK